MSNAKHAWIAPKANTAQSLQIYNSLTQSKIPFIPLDPAGRTVTWYCCGPTVYDSSHLGHARNYLSTDILRRIMRDYFGYDVILVQNVTDVDDKIIVRARERHFFRLYVEEHTAIDKQVFSDVANACEWFSQEKIILVAKKAGLAGFPAQPSHSAILKWVDSSDINSTEQTSDTIVILKNAISSLRHTLRVLEDAKSQTSWSQNAVDQFYTAVDSVLSVYLGFTRKREISPDDQSIFSNFTKHWERDFNHDLYMLNCLPPTVTTRVSEFIPENIAFVQKIIDNGFAYALPNGSVYFDINAFEQAGHTYLKLEPSKRSTDKKPENAVAVDASDDHDEATQEIKLEKQLKRSPGDFALWKNGRVGEPGWESPWGVGRPGWHIECSAMCSEVLGSSIDIHSGGIDLKFPHHDNELAQSEAFWHANQSEAGAGHQWVNYFIHIGHLSIAGSKMSKSLKNFTTIRQALTSGEWTARKLRVLFMMGGWRAGIEISPRMRQEVDTWEMMLNNFFSTVRALKGEERKALEAGITVPHLFRSQERVLYDKFTKARNNMHVALCDSFNTSAALDAISDIVTTANTYLRDNQRTTAQPDAYFSLDALKDIAQWVTRMLTTFGFDAFDDVSKGDRIGWLSADHTNTSEAPSSASVEPYVHVLSTFRDRVKALAIAHGSSTPISRELLTLSDKIRDEDLVSLGVSLEDRNSALGEPALVKFAPAAELIAARDEKVRQQQAKKVADADKAKAREELERVAAEKAKVDPREMFRTAEYSEWDALGIPLKDRDGNEVSKSKSKSLKKAWEKQQKLYESRSM